MKTVFAVAPLCWRANKVLHYGNSRRRQWLSTTTAGKGSSDETQQSSTGFWRWHVEWENTGSLKNHEGLLLLPHVRMLPRGKMRVGNLLLLSSIN